MTNRDALIALIGTIPGLDPNTIDKAFIDSGINGALTYVSGMDSQLAPLSISILESCLIGFQVSEGGYNVKVDPKAIGERINYIAQKYGLNSINFGTPTIRGLHIW